MNVLVMVAALALAAAAPTTAQPPQPPQRARTLALLACDDRAVLHVNGEAVGEVVQWDLALQVDVSGDAFPLTLAVEARNFGGPGALVGALRRTEADGATMEVAAAWRCAATLEPGWQLPEFDDRHWTPAEEVAPYGQGLWGDQARLGLRQASWVWLHPPARPNETIYCRWRAEAP